MAARTFAKIFIYFTTLFVSLFRVTHYIGWRLPANRNIYKLCILLTCVLLLLLMQRTQGVPQGMTKIELVCGRKVCSTCAFNDLFFLRRETQMIVAKFVNEIYR